MFSFLLINLDTSVHYQTNKITQDGRFEVMLSTNFSHWLFFCLFVCLLVRIFFIYLTYAIG